MAQARLYKVRVQTIRTPALAFLELPLPASARLDLRQAETALPAFQASRMALREHRIQLPHWPPASKAPTTVPPLPFGQTATVVNFFTGTTAQASTSSPSMTPAPRRSEALPSSLEFRVWMLWTRVRSPRSPASTRRERRCCRIWFGGISLRRLRGQRRHQQWLRACRSGCVEHRRAHGRIRRRRQSEVTSPG